MKQQDLGAIDQQSEQYRRGQVLGFTMAEIILILLFLLLLLLGSKIDLLSEELLTAFASDTPEYASATNLSDTLIELKQRDLVSPDRDVEWLSERLVLVAEVAIAAGGDLKVEDMEIIDGMKERVDDLMVESKSLREENTALKEELLDAEKLQSQLALDDELIGIVTKRNTTPSEIRQCLLNCGGGATACWGVSLAKPDFIYNIALFNTFLVVSPDPKSVERNSSDWSSLPIEARIEKPTVMTTSEFRKAFSSLKRHAEAKDCVFQTRVVDQDTANKEIYKRQKKLVDGYTYSSNFRNWVYGDFPVVERNMPK